MFSVPEIVRHYRRGTKALPADSGGIKRVWGYDNGGKGSMVGGLSHFDAAGNGGNDSKVQGSKARNHRRRRSYHQILTTEVPALISFIQKVTSKFSSGGRSLFARVSASWLAVHLHKREGWCISLTTSKLYLVSLAMIWISVVLFTSN